MDLDLSSVLATQAIIEAVELVLVGGSCEEKLRGELMRWKSGKWYGGRGGEYGVQEGSIPFDLVLGMHEQLQRTPLGKKK